MHSTLVCIFILAWSYRLRESLDVIHCQSSHDPRWKGLISLFKLKILQFNFYNRNTYQSHKFNSLNSDPLIWWSFITAVVITCLSVDVHLGLRVFLCASLMNYLSFSASFLSYPNAEAIICVAVFLQPALFVRSMVINLPDSLVHITSHVMPGLQFAELLSHPGH